MSFNDEKEQSLFTAVLRAGNAPAQAGAIGILRRILRRVWEAFPKARVRVRLDGGFADPQLLDVLDDVGVESVVAMGKNAVLERLAEPEMQEARRLSQQSGKTEHVYGEGRYRAGSWRRERSVIFKAEVVRAEGKERKDNPRFVITNLKQNPQWIYERIYCARGEIENRIKELHVGLEIDRTRCTSFWANQFRVLMTAAAYALLQEIRLRASYTACARAQTYDQKPRRRLWELIGRNNQHGFRGINNQPGGEPKICHEATNALDITRGAPAIADMDQSPEQRIRRGPSWMVPAVPSRS